MTNLTYILSSSYTGSTLLTFLLAAHQRIGTVGELKASSRGDIDQYHCSCGELIRQCVFWQHLQRDLTQRDIPFDITDLGTHFRCNSSRFADRVMRTSVRGPLFEMLRKICLKALPAARYRFKKILTNNKGIIDAVLKLQQADMFLDGSKDPIRLKYLNDCGYWKIKTVFLIRDGRGAVNSFMKHYSVDMKTAAEEWKRCNVEAETLLRTFDSSQWIKLHYEDLCEDTENSLGRLFEFFDLDHVECVKDFGSAQNHILGNSMRLNKTSEITLDEKWRRDLSEEDLRIFDSIAGEMNRQYGYK